MNRIIYFLLFLFINVSFSQNEANNWYFGNYAGITFNNGAPTVLTDSALSTYEGCATISDSSGQLLFYTDGITVYNRNHNIMPNGTGLLGDPSSTQSSIIVPQPNNTNLYYVFTVDDLLTNINGLRYSIVDMTLNNGFGDVTSVKNELLVTPTSEKVTAVLHANGQDIWVISRGFDNNEFYAYLVTDTGLNTVPVTSATGIIISHLGNFYRGTGVLKASPNGDKLVMCVSGIGTQLFDFDSSTGMVSNPIDIYIGLANYGAEFSPSSNLLYTKRGFLEPSSLWQYNLTATDIPNSGILLFELSEDELEDEQEVGQMQIGPDNKIYVSIKNKDYLSVINNPEVLGLGCDFVSDAIYLQGNVCRYGLPTFIQSYFFVGFESNNPCLGEETNFSANIPQAYDSLVWDFGEGNTSTDENPTHTYTTAGEYEVSLSVTVGAENSLESKTITVYELPVVTPIVELKQCDDDLDGFSLFNLTEINELLSVNHDNEIITFYETEADAESDTNAITDETSYSNETVNIDTVWARVENTNGCYETAQVNLLVSTTQIPETFTRDFYQCDDGADLTDGISTFDFSTVTSEIEALFPVGQQLLINYYTTVSDALSETNAINDISNYQNIGFPNHQNIYVRVDNALNNDCLGLGHHITLHVNPVPLITGPIIFEQCDEGNDGIESFDTSGVETELLIGQTEPIVFTYVDELGNTYPSPLPSPIVSNVPVLNIFATMTIEDATSPLGGCSVQTTISLSISSGVTAHPVSDFSVCDTNGDGLHEFDTSTIEATVLNGQSDVVLSYFEADGTILTNPLPNPYIISSKSIVARVESTLNSFCFDETIIEFQVNEVPIANTISNDFVCDDASNDGEHVFTLSNYDNQILGGQSDAIFDVFYFDSLENAEQHINPLQDNFVVASESVTVYAKIQNTNDAVCNDIVSFQLGVNYFPVAEQPQSISVCDDAINDGFTELNLTNFDEEILGDLNPSGFSVSYYLSLNDAIEDHNQTAYNYTNTTNPQTFYARLENVNSPQCFTTTSVEITVKEQPVLEMNEYWPLCNNHSVEIIADFGYDYYNWSTGQTTRAIVVNEPGEYTVVVSNDYGNLMCTTEKTVLVSLSDIAVIAAIETVDWSQSTNVISVFVEGIGDYEYSLDGINYQDAHIFEGLQIDDYHVYVRDKNGCGVIVEEIYLLNYPRYFTPNDDGTNDFWQIKNSIKEPSNKVYIYNRYGKLITELKPNDSGWDGTLNGNKLPSSDYWFVLERQDGKTYTGHFTLKR